MLIATCLLGAGVSTPTAFAMADPSPATEDTEVKKTPLQHLKELVEELKTDLEKLKEYPEYDRSQYPLQKELWDSNLSFGEREMGRVSSLKEEDSAVSEIPQRLFDFRNHIIWERLTRQVAQYRKKYPDNKEIEEEYKQHLEQTDSKNYASQEASNLQASVNEAEQAFEKIKEIAKEIESKRTLVQKLKELIQKIEMDLEELEKFPKYDVSDYPMQSSLWSQLLGIGKSDMEHALTLKDDSPKILEFSDKLADFKNYITWERLTREVNQYRKKHPNNEEIEEEYKRHLEQTEDSTYATQEGSVLKISTNNAVQVLEKIKEIVKKLESKEEPAPTPAPKVEEETEAPKTEEKTPESKEGSAPAPKEEEIPAPMPETPAPKEGAPKAEEETPKVEEETQAPKTEEKAPESKEDTPAPTPEEPKAESEVPQTEPAPKAEEPVPTPAPTPKDDDEVPAPMPEAPAPKDDEVPAPTPIPETPKAEDEVPVPTPEAEAPKAEEDTPAPAPAPETPMDEPKMEAPKTDKVESDKQMPEAKQPEMEQPKAEDSAPKTAVPEVAPKTAEKPKLDFTTKERKVEEALPIKEEIRYDASLALGKSYLLQEGKAGKKVSVYQDVIVDGKVVATSLLSETVVEGQNRIIVKGSLEMKKEEVKTTPSVQSNPKLSHKGAPSANKATLPATGEQRNNLALVGLGLAGISLAVVATAINKKSKDQI